MTDVFTYFASTRRQQSIITEPSAAHSMTNLPPWSMISLSGNLNAPLTAVGCLVKNACGEPNSNSKVLQGVHQPTRSNCCKRHHATKTKQVANLRRPEGEVHALRLNNRLESLQTMCTQGHEYKINGFGVRSSVIINRLPTPMANN